MSSCLMKVVINQHKRNSTLATSYWHQSSWVLLLDKLKSGLSGLLIPNCIQVSMDGSDVNWKMSEDALQQELKDDSNVEYWKL